ncbi:MAG: cadherin-like domain-containing protein [Bacteroidales bacterium]
MLFNSPAIAMRDSFTFKDELSPVIVSSQDGILKNDFDLDGDDLVALVVESTKNGEIILNNEGSFVYYPNVNFNGNDTLKYFLYDGYSISTPNIAIFTVENNNTEINNVNLTDKLSVFPNPFQSNLMVKTAIPFTEISLFDLKGKCLKRYNYKGIAYNINLSDLNFGAYLLVVKLEDTYHSVKIVKQ